MSRILDVYLYHHYAGQLIQNDSGSLSFSYDETYINMGGDSLSISLPLVPEVFDVDRIKAFFAGILPDDIARFKLAKYLGLSEKNPFALLEVIGGECAGALSLYPQGQKPQENTPDDLEVLDDSKLQDILNLLKNRSLLAGDDGLRLSLAGAQDKIAVGLQDDKIVLVKGTSPTTHILKPVNDSIAGSVHNELFCMRLARMIEIDAPHSEIRYVGNTPYFLIERYDRIKDKDGHTIRLHQEDFCQALGIMPDMKYEREGGPNFNQCKELIRKNFAKPAVDQIYLLERVIFNYLIGNADAHGKNFSLLYNAKKPKLAPAYDLLSTAVYANLSGKMAMKTGGKYKPEDVHLRHWHRLVPDTTAAKRNLEKQLITLSSKCVEGAGVLKANLKEEGITSVIFDQICEVIAKRARHIEIKIN